MAGLPQGALLGGVSFAAMGGAMALMRAGESGNPVSQVLEGIAYGGCCGICWGSVWGTFSGIIARGQVSVRSGGYTGLLQGVFFSAILMMMQSNLRSGVRGSVWVLVPWGWEGHLTWQAALHWVAAIFLSGIYGAIWGAVIGIHRPRKRLDIIAN